MIMVTKRTRLAAWWWVGLAIVIALEAWAIVADGSTVADARVSLVVPAFAACVATWMLVGTLIADLRRLRKSNDNNSTTPPPTSAPRPHDDQFARDMARIEADHAANLAAIEARSARHKTMVDELVALQLRLFRTTDAEQQERLEVQRELAGLSERAIKDGVSPWVWLPALLLPWLLHRGDEIERALAATRAGKDEPKP